MQKNQEIVLQITDITTEGSGVGKYNGLAIFVPLTAVGDTAKVKILKVKKSYAYGKLMELIVPSEKRIQNNCPHFSKCGGCAFRHISYSSECELKSNKVYEAIKRIGGVDMKPQPIIFDCDERYRNKAQYPVSENGNVGFYAFHSHRIIECGDCLLQPEIFKNITDCVTDWVKANNISIYDEEKHKGLLRHIYIRKAQVTNEIMVAFVINGEDLSCDDLIEKLKLVCGDNLKSVILNINKENTNVILGKTCKTLYGADYINDILCGVKIRLSPLSFYQVNHTMAQKLYEKAKEYANPKDKNIIDLYCGAGTIGLSMSKAAKNIIGVEIIPQAIEDAKFNAKANGIENARFICADALAAAEQLAREGVTSDTVIVDPPRKGCEKQVIEIIANNFKPKSVVYVSCDPATLARDIKIFEELGYKLQEYTPADLFPRTSHIETVALLSRQKYENEYEEYFMNRTVEDIMIEYGEQRDEWKSVC